MLKVWDGGGPSWGKWILNHLFCHHLLCDWITTRLKLKPFFENQIPIKFGSTFILVWLKHQCTEFELKLNMSKYNSLK